MAEPEQAETEPLCLIDCTKSKVGKGENNMKTKEELKALKEEVETLNRKLAELNEEELEQVSGGLFGLIMPVVNSEEPAIEALPRVIDLTDKL